MVSGTRPISRVAVRSILSQHPDPLRVLATTARVVQRARHVTIDPLRVDSVAQVLAIRGLTVPAWNYSYHFFDGGERTVNYLFLLDTLNFSFWGEPRWEVSYRGERLNGYWALAAALKRAAEENDNTLDPTYLAEISPKELTRMLRGRNEIPMLAERWRNVQELGRVLRDRFGGSAGRMVKAADNDAPSLAQLVANNLQSFADKAVYDHRAVIFYKRAQILVADIYGAFGGKDWGHFKNVDELTAFADYKLPQILRAWRILKYDRTLARRVDDRSELAKDSTEEIEIRACTLWGVELLRQALARHGRILTSVQMDWFLWENSQNLSSHVKPYHRVRTTYY